MFDFILQLHSWDNKCSHKLKNSREGPRYIASGLNITRCGAPIVKPHIRSTKANRHGKERGNGEFGGSDVSNPQSKSVCLEPKNIPSVRIT